MTGSGFEPPEGTPRPWGRPLTVGVLGGMGPHATVQFMKNVYDRTPAKKDWEHVRLVVDSNCHVPSRTRAVLFGETSPLEGMIDSCRRLQRYPVDAIAVPCNSACNWLAELRHAIKTPILDIVSIASREVMRNPGVRRVAALGGEVPHRTALYAPAVAACGGELVRIDDAEQARVSSAIEAIKAAGAPDDRLRMAFGELVSQLARAHQLDAVILACTEFSFFADLGFELPVVDSSSALAQAVVDYAYWGKPLPLDTGEVRRFWEKRAELLDRGDAGLLQSTMLTASEEEAALRFEKERAALLVACEPILRKDDTVLELGCGAGRWSRVLARHVRAIDAYDYSERLVAAARRLAREEGLDNVEFRCAAVEEIACDRTYDATLSVALLHYLAEPQFEAAMSLVREALRPGGHAIFRETFGNGRRFELHGFHSDVLDAEYHAVYRTPAELGRALGPELEAVAEQIVLPPADDKPETYQGLAIFRKK